ncbi:MAG: ribonuclease P protein subunit, partial [Bacteroidales bacterium]|nr:ribonuclease P protein subunit [Bacteroidales bacterium]
MSTIWQTTSAAWPKPKSTASTRNEFIGLKVHAASKKNKSLNLKGTIIDETKNTIKI